MPLLSVITINLNNADGLEKTMRSVRSQNFSDMEYVVVDGGSSDNSLKVLESNKDIVSKMISEKDSGIYNAMNKAIELSAGEYLLFINSGDVLCEGILPRVRAELKDQDILYGDLITVNEKGEKAEHMSFDRAGVDELQLSTIWHPCTFFRRTVFDSCGKYDETFRLAGDYEFYVRSILKHGVSYRHIHLFIAEFQIGGLSNRKENEALMARERELAWKRNFSDVMISFFNRSLALKRGREYRIGKLITRFIPS